MKKVAFHNLGCKVNSYEMDGIMQMFQKQGYEIVDFAQKADIYVINTCTVTNIADRKSRQMIHRAKAQNPEAVVVATGCYVQTDTKGALKDEAVDLIVGNNRKTRIVEYVEAYLDRKKSADTGEEGNEDLKTLCGKTVIDVSKPCEYENFSITQTIEHTRAYIKIQDGCNQFCSYCAIPLARGRVRSRNLSEILTEVKALAESGYKEIVITGIHLSSYGIAKAYNILASEGGTNEELLKVIEEISKVDGVSRIRLGSLEPRLVTDDFAARLSKIPKLCPHFHLSLQSGSDAVLRRMNRHYDAIDFTNTVGIIRKYFAHPAVTTDVIVGFPAESEEEFEESRELLARTNLYEVHIFKYSRRRGTVADRMEGQVPEAVKTARSRILIEEADARKRNFAEYYIGREVNVLTEDYEVIDGRKYRVGYTPEYVKCAVEGDADGDDILTAKGMHVKEGILFVSRV